MFIFLFIFNNKINILKLYSKFLIILQFCVTSQISVNAYNLTMYKY